MKRCIPLLLSGLLLLALPAAAQPVSPHVSLTRPADAAANRLDLLRTAEPAVVLLNSEQTAGEVPNGRQMVRDAVLQWEMFLLGLNIPYRLASDRDLARGVSGETRLLILPAAEALSDGQRRQVERFLERGGGVIASGRVGLFDERGRNAGDQFFRDVFGAELVSTLPEQPAGILQALDGGHAPTVGLPMGYRLNLAPQLPTAAARPLTATGLGRPYPYTYRPGDANDPFANVTLVLYGTRGAGSVFWTRFHPQDVSRETEQQAVYQALVINAMAALSGVPMAGLRPWPNGQPSATVFAAQPMIGNDADFHSGANRVLGALEAAQAPATFFLTSKEAVLFPDLIQRIDRAGEVALSADTDGVLKKQPVEVQSRRLEAGLTDLRTAAGQPVMGLSPPGGFYDVNTVRAMRQAGLRYMLLAVPGESAAPRPLNWYDDVDYREPLLADAGATAVGARTAAPVDRVMALPSTGRDDYTVLTLLNTAADPAAQFTLYREDFARIHAAQGLYVLPFHAELQGRTDERAGVLRQLAELARRQGSWVTTLRDVHQWWLQRAQVGLNIVESTDRSITIELMNGSNQPVTNLSFDVVPGGLVTNLTADGGAAARLSGTGRTATVIVPTVRSGTNRITLSFNRR